VCGGREQFDFDCKSDINDKDTFELAKDVAAFANLAGGVILVGAYEDRARGTIGRYSPFDEQRANQIAGAYSQSVAQRCSPAPVIDPTVLPRDAGHVVAVNVWPFPAQVVGVKLNDGGRSAWVFPLRVGKDSIEIKPEQLPMLMVPEVRRVALLLRQIEINEKDRASVLVFHKPPTAGALSKMELRLDKIDLLENVAAFHGIGPLPNVPVHVPLDAVRSVWRSPEGGWSILIAGGINQGQSSQGERTLFFVPSEPAQR
jgi:schlafen family protein